MAKVVGDIAVMVSADTAAFEAGMARAGKSTEAFGGKAAKLGTFIGKATASIGLASPVLIEFGRRTFDAAKEIENLSRLAGIGTTDFQKYAFAARSVGINQEKLADILKDVGDKFGDFLSNGAGPLKDFFDNIAPKVGVTAKEFARLSGPDALQLYVRSLEQAGVSQKQMTFYMEALASDATALVPLLQDGGQALRDLGIVAEESGAVISEALVKSGGEMAEYFRKTMESMVGYAKIGFLQIAKMAGDAFGITEEGKLSSMRDQLDSLLEQKSGLEGQIEKMRELSGQSLMSGIGGSEPTAAMEILAATEEEINVVNNNIAELGKAAERRQEALARILDASSGIDPSGPSGKGGAKDNGLDAFREGLATQSEALEMWRSEQMEKLIEYRETKAITEAEYNELEARIAKEHADRLAQIQSAAMEGRLNKMKTIFSGFSSLMQSENDKLFKIGKAAALAQAIVDGHQSAVAAWKHGMTAGGPPLAAAFAAASVIKTASIISSIASASPRGTSSGGAAGGGAAPAPVQSVNKTVDVRLIGGDAVTQQNMRSLVNALGEYIRDGGQISGLRMA